MFDLDEALKNLPDNPGVYIMHSADDTVIYVGKAKNLKNRVRQYFQNSKNHTPKVRAMVSRVAYFEYIVTDSEKEALVLECNLIKKHRPKYNILLKDDKHYPYIKVSINEEYPRIFMSRVLKNDGAKYFGPYMGMQTVRAAMEIVQKIFKPPTCTRKFPADIGKGRPCLNYHINNCFAPCIAGNVSKEEYRKIYFEICKFLEGNHSELLGEMTQRMKTASQNLEFEKAAALRDKIEAVKRFEEKQKIINVDKQSDADIIAFTRLNAHSFFEIFFIRRGKVSGRLSYRLDETADIPDGEIMSDFIKGYYSEHGDIPEEILTECAADDSDLLSEWISKRKGKRVKFVVPKRGEKKQLVSMVHKNAEISAENYRLAGIKLAGNRDKISSEIAKKLGLETVPKRIESYDISNISGSDNVASMVVFSDGKPSKKDYRHFKIKSTDGANDYLAMQEVIYRRLRRAHDETEKVNDGVMDISDAKFLPLPDLILLDGGKGHLSAVTEIAEATDCDIPIFGMVKDNKHRTRALVSENGEIALSPTDSVFRFVTLVQDEVHRSAVTYHRKLRSAGMTKSELDSIKGVGKVKKNKLLTHFKSVENICNAPLTEIEKIVDKKTAYAVYMYFKENVDVQTD